MAIPAFQKSRQQSQDNIVLNNARQLAAAADQYYLENGVSNVMIVNLFGPGKALKGYPNRVAKEIYPDWYTEGITITVYSIARSRTITYAP